MINRIEDLLPRPKSSAGTADDESCPKPGGLDVRKLIGQLGDFAGRNPGTCLAAAFGLGVVVAWLIKRK